MSQVISGMSVAGDLKRKIKSRMNLAWNLNWKTFSKRIKKFSIQYRSDNYLLMLVFFHSDVLLFKINITIYQGWPDFFKLQPNKIIIFYPGPHHSKKLILKLQFLQSRKNLVLLMLLLTVFDQISHNKGRKNELEDRTLAIHVCNMPWFQDKLRSLVLLRAWNVPQVLQQTAISQIILFKSNEIFPNRPLN